MTELELRELRKAYAYIFIPPRQWRRMTESRIYTLKINKSCNVQAFRNKQLIFELAIITLDLSSCSSFRTIIPLKLILLNLLSLL